MKNYIIKCLILILLIATISCIRENKKPIIKNDSLKTEKKSSKSDSIVSINKSKLIQDENIFEIHQYFPSVNDKSTLDSEVYNIDLTVTSGAMISAYSEYKGDYSIFFRTKENNKWSDWLKLEENEEVKNPKRKVFSPKSLNSSVKQIQFKSDQIINDKVIFRIFTFKKT